MQKKDLLSKIFDSIKRKLALPIAGAIFFSGCYAVIDIQRLPTTKHIHYNFLHDWDGDGIPDIYDAHPYFYDYPFLGRPYYNPHFNHMNHWYSFPPQKNDYKKSPPKIQERKKDTERLRNHSGERDSKRKR